MGAKNKMNKKTAISIVLTLLIIASAFSAMSVNANELSACNDVPDGGDEIVENLEVTKEIWNGDGWVDEYTAEIGETVTFKITITYHEICGYKATNITVVDDMDFVGDLSATWDDFNPIPDDTDLPITWTLDDELFEGESIVITFNVTITSGYGELNNTVEVNAIETCCGGDLYGKDSAKIIVEEPPCEPEIELIKKVWNGTAWADFADGFELDDIVKFKIEMIYHDCGSGYEILNMVVEDDLPCCLEYDETVYEDTIKITTTGEMDDPSVEIMNDKVIFWNWTFDRHVVLHDGDSITIEFGALFTQYCRGISENWAYVTAWGCSGPTFEDSDYAEVDCTPEDTTFEKLVWNGEEWVEEIETNTMADLTFSIALTYHGVEILTDLSFLDQLPCILEYVDSTVYGPIDEDDETQPEEIEIEPELSEDGKTIWWNLTGVELKDGEMILIILYVTVTGTTGDCCQCEYVVNYASVTGRRGCTQEPNFFMEDEVIIRSEMNCPPSTPFIKGPRNGEVDEELDFTFVSIDPNGDQILTYNINWGDSEYNSVFNGPFNSGQEKTFSHTYTEAGTYKIKAWAADVNYLVSPWTPEGYEFEVVITEEQISLGITLPKQSKGLISATVKNNGGDDLEDIDWKIIATGGIFGKVDIETDGTFDLDGGESKEIQSDAIGLGLGKITGYVKVSIGDYTKKVEFDAFLIGKIVIFSS